MFRRKVKDPHGRKWTLGRPVVGYFNSRRRIDELACQLSSGAQLPPGHR